MTEKTYKPGMNPASADLTRADPRGARDVLPDLTLVALALENAVQANARILAAKDGE